VPPDRLLGRVAGDVTGDGLMDLVQLVRADDGVAVEVILGSASGFVPATRWWGDAADPAGLGEGTYRLVVADFTGDGRADAGILRIRAGGVPVTPTDPAAPPPDPSLPPSPPSTTLLLAASTGSALGAVKRTWTIDADLSAAEFRAGDVNGDGLADLAILAPGAPAGPDLPALGTDLRVALAAPNGLLQPATTWGMDAAPLASMRALIGDANRDGRDDLIVVRRVGDDGTQVVVYRGPTSGTVFSRRSFTGVLPLSFAGTRFSSADSSADGRSDLFALVDLGVDAEGTSLGTSVMRLLSDGVAFSIDPWVNDPALHWVTAAPH
jgi:hypothetical protein